MGTAHDKDGTNQKSRGLLLCGCHGFGNSLFLPLSLPRFLIQLRTNRHQSERIPFSFPSRRLFGWAQKQAHHIPVPEVPPSLISFSPNRLDRLVRALGTRTGSFTRSSSFSLMGRAAWVRLYPNYGKIERVRGRSGHQAAGAGSRYRFRIASDRQHAGGLRVRACWHIRKPISRLLRIRSRVRSSLIPCQSRIVMRRGGSRLGLSAFGLGTVEAHIHQIQRRAGSDSELDAAFGAHSHRVGSFSFL